MPGANDSTRTGEREGSKASHQSWRRPDPCALGSSGSTPDRGLPLLGESLEESTKRHPPARFDQKQVNIPRRRCLEAPPENSVRVPSQEQTAKELHPWPNRSACEQHERCGNVLGLPAKERKSRSFGNRDSTQRLLSLNLSVNLGRPNPKGGTLPGAAWPHAHCPLVHGLRD